MKFTLKKAFIKEWKEKGIKFWIYSSKDDLKSASGVYIETVKGGRHGKVKTSLSDRTYFVIDGEGEFVIGGKKFMARKGDVVIIPKNTIYDYKVVKGKLKLFLVHTPAYDGDYEVRYEERAGEE